MVPLAKSHSGRIEALRELVTTGQCRNASVRSEKQVVDFSRIRGTRLMDIEHVVERAFSPVTNDGCRTAAFRRRE